MFAFSNPLTYLEKFTNSYKGGLVGAKFHFRSIETDFIIATESYINLFIYPGSFVVLFVASLGVCQFIKPTFPSNSISVGFLGVVFLSGYWFFTSVSSEFYLSSIISLFIISFYF